MRCKSAKQSVTLSFLEKCSNAGFFRKFSTTPRWPTSTGTSTKWINLTGPSLRSFTSTTASPWWEKFRHFFVGEIDLPNATLFFSCFVVTAKAIFGLFGREDWVQRWESSVTRKGDFYSSLASNFLTKVALTFADFLGFWNPPLLK